MAMKVQQNDVGAAAQARLTELLTEMQALMRVLPAGAGSASAAMPERAGRAEDIARSEEDAVEDGFDNMPL